MTLSELEAWRKRVPWFIISLCILPWFVSNSKDLAQAKLYSETLVPIAALVATFFYSGSDFRRSLWKREIDMHVGNQIRDALLSMVPKDLEITESEKQDLLQKEIFRELTGVFWEAVDRSERLRAHKEHFYSNGIVYSTSIDVFLIGGLAGFVYAVTSLFKRNADLAYVAAFFVAIALASRIIVTPRRRKRHLALSAEQLDLLRREQSEFVSSRFREIIVGWRRDRVLH